MVFQQQCAGTQRKESYLNEGIVAMGENKNKSLQISATVQRCFKHKMLGIRCWEFWQFDFGGCRPPQFMAAVNHLEGGC